MRPLQLSIARITSSVGYFSVVLLVKCSTLYKKWSEFSLYLSLSNHFFWSEYRVNRTRFHSLSSEFSLYWSQKIHSSTSEISSLHFFYYPARLIQDFVLNQMTFISQDCLLCQINCGTLNSKFLIPLLAQIFLVCFSFAFF